MFAKRKGASPLPVLSISGFGECIALLRGAAFVIRIGQKFAHGCRNPRKRVTLPNFQQSVTKGYTRSATTPRIGPGVGVGVGVPMFPMEKRPRRSPVAPGALDGGGPAIGSSVGVCTIP